MSQPLRSFDIACRGCSHEDTVTHPPSFAGHVANGDVKCPDCHGSDIEILSDRPAGPGAALEVTS